MNFARKLKQKATYWAPGLPDPYGRVTFEALPVEIDVRWEDSAELFRDAQGNEAVSRAVIYTLTQLAVTGWVQLGNAAVGTLSDPRVLEGAQEIRQIGTSPSLRATQQLFKVMV